MLHLHSKSLAARNQVLFAGGARDGGAATGGPEAPGGRSVL